MHASLGGTSCKVEQPLTKRKAVGSTPTEGLILPNDKDQTAASKTNQLKTPHES